MNAVDTLAGINTAGGSFQKESKINAELNDGINNLDYVCTLCS